MRDAPPHDPGERQVWQRRWTPDSTQEELVRVWCDDEHHHDWLEFSKLTAVTAAKNRGVVRAFPAQRG